MENRQNSSSHGVVSSAAVAAADVYLSLGTQRRARPVEVLIPSATLLNMRHSGGSHASSTVGIARPATALDVPGSTSPAKRVRKDRGPNWQAEEVIALTGAKRAQFLDEGEVHDSRDLMNVDSTKWARISLEVMRAGFSRCLRDGPACKSKWNQMVPDYKKISDYFARTGTCSRYYWRMNAIQRKAECLPRSFSEEYFYAIDEWYGNRPNMQPPHMRDLLSAQNVNYEPANTEVEDTDDYGTSERESDDPVVAAGIAEEDSSDQTPSAFSPIPTQAQPWTQTRADSFRTDQTWSQTCRPKASLPAGVTAHVLSSSDTAENAVYRRPGNTGVRRKSLSGHTLIAQATKATGDAMAHQMRDMAEASRDVEKSKMDIQEKLFAEQMVYQKDRDARILENARFANENAKLAILKQTEVVQCLSNLALVLSKGLQHTRETVGINEPQVAHTATVQAVQLPTTLPDCTPSTSTRSSDIVEDQTSAL